MKNMKIAISAFCMVAGAYGGGLFAAVSDDWENAVELSGMSGSVTASNRTATVERGEPFEVNGDKTTVWWKWAPAAATKAVFDTYGSDFNTVLGVYAGTSVSTLVEVACNDIRFADRTSSVSFDVASGTTYYICVSGHKEGFGEIKLNWKAVNGGAVFIVQEDGSLTDFVGACPENVTIPDRVTKISMSVFDHDHDASVDNLKGVEMPGSVTNIEQYAFYGCANLSAVTFDEGLETISYNAFQLCTSLATIDLPKTVIDVTGDAFNDMDRTVTVKAPRSLIGMLTNGVYGTTVLNVSYYINVPLDPGAGSLEESSRAFQIVGRDVYGDLPVPQRVGYEFTGWKQGARVVDGNTVLPDVAATTLTAEWAVKSVEITFDANGGSGGTSESLEYGSPLVAPDVMWDNGHEFIGWSPAVPDTVPATNATYVAQWEEVTATITIDVGDGTATNGEFSAGTKVGELPTPAKKGYVFDGWYSMAAGGERFSDDTVLESGMKLYAHWRKESSGGDGGGDDPIQPEPTVKSYRLYENVAGLVPQTSASTYDGYLYGDGDEVKGVIQVKVGKPNKRTNQASVKAVVQLAGKKKVNIKAAGKGKAEIAADGVTVVQMSGGDTCSVTLGSYGLSGQYGAYRIDGARNFFGSKDKEEVSEANAVLKPWLGSVNISSAEGSLTVTLSAKGKAKVTGTLADGTKVSGVSSQFAIGEEWCCVPVVWTKKNHFLAFALWLGRSNSSVDVVGLDDYVAGSPKTLRVGAKFLVNKSAALWSQIAGTVKTDYLPDGLGVVQSGVKWILPKAGKVVYLRGSSEVDTTKLGDNPSGLKLSYKSKDGTFKGSFKVYSDVGGRLKATTVTVTGVLVDGVGYGTATVKNTGSVAVVIGQ